MRYDKMCKSATFLFAYNNILTGKLSVEFFMSNVLLEKSSFSLFCPDKSFADIASLNVSKYGSCFGIIAEDACSKSSHAHKQKEENLCNSVFLILFDTTALSTDCGNCSKNKAYFLFVREPNLSEPW